MTRTLQELKNDFVVLDLGSAHTEGVLRQVPGLTETITRIEVDALLDKTSSPARQPNKIALTKAVSGTPGKRVFRQRKFPQCSSFLPPKQHLVSAYGLADYFVEVNSITFECATIRELLREQAISRVDFFKTDLEGLDLEVLASAPELVEQSLCVQNELRFQPFYEGEAAFHEVVAFLVQRGFELVSIKPQVWKYATPDRDRQRDGRTVWADSIFFLSPERVYERFPSNTWKCFAKQIILARLLNLENFGQHLFQSTASLYSADVKRELSDFVRPDFSFGQALANAIDRLPLGWGMLGLTRRISKYLFKTASLYQHRHLAEV